MKPFKLNIGSLLEGPFEESTTFESVCAYDENYLKAFEILNQLEAESQISYDERGILEATFMIFYHYFIDRLNSVTL